MLKKNSKNIGKMVEIIGLSKKIIGIYEEKPNLYSRNTVSQMKSI